jgi:hypothetical protein
MTDKKIVSWYAGDEDAVNRSKEKQLIVDG